MAAAAGGVGPATGRVTGTVGRGTAGRTGAFALPSPKRRLLRVPATVASASGPILRPRRRKDRVVGRANAADRVEGWPPEVDDMVVGRAEAVEEGVDVRPPKEGLAGGHCHAHGGGDWSGAGAEHRARLPHWPGARPLQGGHRGAATEEERGSRGRPMRLREGAGAAYTAARGSGGGESGGRRRV